MEGLISPVSSLVDHEANSTKRAETILGAVYECADKLKQHIKKHSTEGDKMGLSIEEAFANLGGRGSGDGFGGSGIFMGLLLGALLRNNNLFGGGGDGAGVALQNTVDTNAILQTLGDIKAAVPLSEAQLQLAIANASSDTIAQTLQQTIGLTSQIAGAKDATVSAAANIANLIQNVNNGLGDKIDANTTQQAIGFGGINTAIERNGWQVTQAINADGEKTRALIQSIDKQNDSRLITSQANEIIELRAERARDADRHGIEINMINNQNQNQLQFQQQAQVLAQLANVIADVGQVARATNQQLIIGNSGVTSGGNQTANPTNVRA